MHERIGVIGQGWVGRNLADNFVRRGYEVIRYSLEEPHINNRDLIKDCDYTFVCVPTPTTNAGFFDDIVRSVLPLTSRVVIIKSTMMPGYTDILQEAYPNKVIMFCPEFLREKTAKEDTEHPERNIIGITNPDHAEIADKVLKLLPHAPYRKITTAKNAEMAKYAGNGFLTMKVLFANLLYDICQYKDIDYGQVKDMISNDSRIGPSHLKPVDGGRGAAGDCFLKDFEGLVQLYEKTGNTAGYYVLQSLKRYNVKLLYETAKDPHILASVYPKKVPDGESEEQIHLDPEREYKRGGRPRKIKDSEVDDDRQNSPFCTL